MPVRRRSKRRRSRMGEDDQDNWKLHDIDQRSSSSQILTRSQAAFISIENTDSDLQLFADPQKHQPPSSDLPHLMVTMKGKWGSIPNTVITRQSGKDIPVSEQLCDKVDMYKKHRGSKPKESLVDGRKGRKRSGSRRRRSRSSRKRSGSGRRRSSSGRKRSSSGRKPSRSRRRN